MSHLDSSIIGARQTQGESEPTILVAQPISEPILRQAARQIGVSDNDPIPQHIVDSAHAIVSAYANMDRPPATEVIERHFLADFTLSQAAQSVRLTAMTFASVLETVQTSLNIMRGEIESDQPIARADPEAIYRAFQTHVASSLDLLQQARGRLEDAMTRYRLSQKR